MHSVWSTCIRYLYIPIYGVRVQRILCVYLCMYVGCMYVYHTMYMCMYAMRTNDSTSYVYASYVAV